MFPSPSPGFRSPDSKRSVTRAVWTGVILVGLLQLVVPAALVVWAVVRAIFGVFTAPSPDFDAPAVLDGHVYYTTKALVNGEDSSAETPRTLVRVPLARDEAPEAVVEVGSHFSEPKLVAAQGAVYLIESNRVTAVRDGRADSVDLDDAIPYEHWPLVYDGSPAVVSFEHDVSTDLDTVDLRTWDGAQWNVVRSSGTELPVDLDELRVVSTGSTIHVFASGYDEPVFHAEFTPDGLSDWASTEIPSSEWTAVAQGGVPVVLQLDFETEPPMLLARRESTGWRTFFSRRLPDASDIAAVPLGGQRLAVVHDQLLDGLAVLEIEEDAVVAEHESSGWSLLQEMIGLIVASQVAPFVLTGLLALILSGRMRVHRVSEYRVGHRVVRYASLTRRGVARAVDTAISAALPLAATMPRVLGGALDDATIVVLAVGLSLPAFVGLCFMEGTLGYSVGKKLVGIRVVDMSLNPCGVGPAFMRNLLGIVDGMFNYLVGIALVATHEHWQRLGDRSANTLVIEAEQR